MKPILFYLLQVISASGLLYGYYHFALRNKKFHRYNRFYLLMAVLISSFIPFLNIPVYFSQQETGSSIMLQTLQVISSPSVIREPSAVSSVMQNESTSVTWFTAENVLYLFYMFILSFFLLRVLISLGKIRSIIKRNSVEQLDKIKFINTDEPGTPFSFFRWLFWNRKIELQSEKGEQIFRHELFHIQQKHSWDIIFVELVSTIFWINPFIHLIKKELKAIHEFLADEFAIKENKNWQYAELLLMQAFNTNNQLVNPFFHNQIKRRIAMITTSQKPSYRYIRKLMVLPVAAIIIFLFAFNYKKRQSDPHEFEKSINSITVVIDAGHGGTDKGAKSKDGKYNEAELSLAIAKKIQALGREYNINVIMTRIDEKFPGDAADKNDALRKRVELVNNIKPHAFIAIHMNTTPENEQMLKTGFDAYITKRRYNYPDNQLASSVLGELKKIYTTREEIKQRGDASINVIDEAKAPSLLLECGFINNPKDISFITKEKNQEEIAKAILVGLAKFANGHLKKHNGSIQYFFDRNGYAIGEKVSDTIKPKNTKELDKYLVVINGEVQEKRGLKSIDSALFSNSQPIEANIYKNQSAIDKYGEKGKDGVIEIYLDNVTKVYNRTGEEVGYMANSKQQYPDTFFSLREVPTVVEESKITGKRNFISDTLIPTKGNPLVVIDGKPFSIGLNEDLNKVVSPKDIQSITILKDKKATDKYGDKAKDGVIEIITKSQGIKDLVIREMTLNNGDNKIFEKVEIEASFPGGATAWRQFLSKNFNPSVPVDSGSKEGAYTVVLQFITDKEGNVSNIRALTNHGFGMEQECIRVMQLSPKWNPALQNGHLVKAYRKQPFTFVIADDVSDNVNEKNDSKEKVVTGYKKPLDPKDIEQLHTVYPNPTSNKITIRYTSKQVEKGEARVYDLMANLKMTSQANFIRGKNNIELNVSSLASGTYIVNIVGADNKTSKTFKLIKK